MSDSPIATLKFKERPAPDWRYIVFNKKTDPPPLPPPVPNHEKKFMVDGELVPVPMIRDKLFTSAATKKAAPIALSNGGFGFQK